MAPHQKIIDLDVLVPPTKTVLFGGKKYTLPGDMPMETYLQVNAAAFRQEEGADEGELMGRMVDALVELFTCETMGTTQEDKDRLTQQFRRLGVSTVTKVLTEIYSGEDDADAAVEAAQADPPVAGTPTS